MDKVLEWLTSANAIASFGWVLGTVLLLFLLQKAYRGIRKREDGKGQKMTLVRMVFGVLRVLIVLIGLLVILQINGINVTSAVAGLGLASAIVGLALQDILKDIIMGIQIVSDRFFSVGDVVLFEGREAEVIHFTVRATVLQDLDNKQITTICNRNISEVTKLPKESFVDLDLSLSYEEDLQNVRKMLSTLCEEIAKLDGVKQCTFEGTEAFADSAVIYRLRFFCMPILRPELKRKALAITQDRLAKEGMAVPFNQLDIHTKA